MGRGGGTPPTPLVCGGQIPSVRFLFEQTGFFLSSAERRSCLMFLYLKDFGSEVLKPCDQDSETPPPPLLQDQVSDCPFLWSAD